VTLNDSEPSQHAHLGPYTIILGNWAWADGAQSVLGPTWATQCTPMAVMHAASGLGELGLGESGLGKMGLGEMGGHQSTIWRMTGNAIQDPPGGD